MDLALDPNSPVPLFHQLAEALRHRIATGVLGQGDPLPGVRAGAGMWQIHFHTVRRAYQVLAEDGLVDMGQGRPTVVTGHRGEVIREDLQEFLEAFLLRGRSVFGLSGQELVSHLAARVSPACGRAVHMVECTSAQASALALEIQERWGVAAQGWALDRPGEPPPGILVVTYFHFKAVRQRWPNRLGDMHFVALHPDPGLPERLRARLGDLPKQLRLVEWDSSMAENVASDMNAVFMPRGIEVIPLVVKKSQCANYVLESAEPCLLSPRVWGDMALGEISHSLAFEAKYQIKQADMLELGKLFETWRK